MQQTILSEIVIKENNTMPCVKDELDLVDEDLDDEADLTDSDDEDSKQISEILWMDFLEEDLDDEDVEEDQYKVMIQFYNLLFLSKKHFMDAKKKSVIRDRSRRAILKNKVVRPVEEEEQWLSK